MKKIEPIPGAVNGKVGVPLVNAEDPDNIRGLSIDRIVPASDFIVMTGWVIGETTVEFKDSSGQIIVPEGINYFTRADVATGYGVSDERVRGFLVIWKRISTEIFTVMFPSKTDRRPFDLHIGLPPASSTATLHDLVSENWSRAGFLLTHLASSPIWVAAIAKILKVRDALTLARGHLEHARGISEVGGIIVGWAAAEPRIHFALIGDDGRFKYLTQAVRWNRQDVMEATSHELGGYAFDAGFLQFWEGPLRLGSRVQLIAIDGERAFELSVVEWQAAPVDPVSYARWAFEFPTPMNKFAERLSNHDGIIINYLVERKIESRLKSPPVVICYGQIPENPEVSIVIPLYGRHDFMLNQLLEFSLDEGLVSKSEIIYVIDDPRLVDPMSSDCALFYDTYGVPFKVVWGGSNRGFAGATNLGVSVGVAPKVLFLNSDVIPVEPGWLNAMVAVLDSHANIGILGARLLYPNGAIQHNGMDFRWEPSWGAHLNKHPGSGFEAGRADVSDVSICIAVTAACMLLDRKLYAEIGGLDELFLIGDFEDSDICLKARKLGLEIGCLQSLSLVHLERQSLSGIGTDKFRDKVARYNAWRHEKKWGQFIVDLMGGGKKK